MLGHKEHSPGHRKYNQHDRSEDNNHATDYFQIWKLIVHVWEEKEAFSGLPIKENPAERCERVRESESISQSDPPSFDEKRNKIS